MYARQNSKLRIQIIDTMSIRYSWLHRDLYMIGPPPRKALVITWQVM